MAGNSYVGNDSISIELDVVSYTFSLKTTMQITTSLVQKPFPLPLYFQNPLIMLHHYQYGLTDVLFSKIESFLQLDDDLEGDNSGDNFGSVLQPMLKEQNHCRCP